VAEFVIATALLGVTWTYWVGLKRLQDRVGTNRRPASKRAVCFGAGMAAAAGALLPPLSTSAEQTLTAHMVQHLLLVVVAAPLLVVGAPLPALLWSLPPRWRDSCLVRWRKLIRVHDHHWVIWTISSLVVAGAVMWSWHVPAFYAAALHKSVIHAAEHGSFLLSAIAFWWAVGLGTGRRHAAAVAFVFAAALPGTALGAALTLASRPWYVDYPALADQQMAGVLMWAFGGLVYVVASACLFGRWLLLLERRAPGRPFLSVVRP